MYRKSILAALFLIAQCATLCQPAPIPAIGAVSIKPHAFPPDNRNAHIVWEATLNLSEKQIDFSGSLPGLVMKAYRLGDYQVVGAPDWLDESGNLQHYDVAFAKPRKPDRVMSELPQILQNVLSERFHLEFHRETREVPGYDLVVDEHGPKFKAGPPGATTNRLPFRYTSSRNYTTGLSVTGLVGLLAFELHRPVIDKTGISGIFDFAESVYDPPEKALFPEVEEQLGLKLIPATETIEVLVIDHVERPSEN
jgi:uncharacterized protein (TIGR03435 family)